MDDPSIIYLPSNQFSKRYDRRFMTLSIPSVEASEDRQYFVYCINCERAGEGAEWFVERRYSQFDHFRNELATAFPQTTTVPFPPKTSWFSRTTPDFLEKRRAKLEKWLQGVLCMDVMVLLHTSTKAFLEIEE